MNNEPSRKAEPIAWMVDGVLFTSLGAALNISFDIEQPCIPLYTHPAKTLTQENHEWDRGVWTVGIDGMTKEFIESSDFHHDVRLYLNGDFETDTQRLNYLQHIADRLNTHPAKTLTDEEILDTFNPKFMCDLEDSDVIDFGKAILRKAQEK